MFSSTQHTTPHSSMSRTLSTLLILTTLFSPSVLLASSHDGFELTSDITGGNPTSLAGYKKFSMVIGTLFRKPNGAFYPIHNCGATMIQRYPPALAVTAAHCVKPVKGPGGGWTDPSNPNKYWAFRGWSGPEGNVQHDQTGEFRAYRIKKVFFPEAWRLSNQPVFADIAIVQLDYGEDGRHFYHIPISTPAMTNELRTGLRHNPDRRMFSFKEEITGWGMDGNTREYALTVQSGTVYDIPKDDCNLWVNGLRKYFDLGASGWEDWIKLKLKEYEQKNDRKNIIKEFSSHLFNLFGMNEVKHYVFDDERCAMDLKNANTSNCYGDSGGPLVWTNPSVSAYHIHTLMGVTSSSIAGDCSPYMPVMYSNVEYYTDWIKSIHACIMIDEMSKWEKQIEQDDPDASKERQYWLKQSQFWDNLKNKDKGKPGRVPDMVKRAKRNRYTQRAFKLFYLKYINSVSSWKTNMQQWCDMRSDIEGVFTDANKEGWGELTHTSDRLNLPGFFPAMIDYSEWLKEHRKEKYHRSWGQRTIISTEKRLITNPKTVNVYVENSLSVSMDLTKSGLNGKTRMIYIPDILEIKVSPAWTEVRVGSEMKLVCDHVMPWVTDWHIVFILEFLKNEITMIVNGTPQPSCNQNILWRRDDDSVLIKKLYWGSSNMDQVTTAYGKRIEYHTWTDPPVCCSDWPDSRGCIANC